MRAGEPSVTNRKDRRLKVPITRCRPTIGPGHVRRYPQNVASPDRDLPAAPRGGRRSRRRRLKPVDQERRWDRLLDPARRFHFQAWRAGADWRPRARTRCGRAGCSRRDLTDAEAAGAAGSTRPTSMGAGAGPRQPVLVAPPRPARAPFSVYVSDRQRDFSRRRTWSRAGDVRSAQTGKSPSLKNYRTRARRDLMSAPARLGPLIRPNEGLGTMLLSNNLLARRRRPVGGAVRNRVAGRVDRPDRTRSLREPNSRQDLS